MGGAMNAVRYLGMRADHRFGVHPIPVPDVRPVEEAIARILAQHPQTLCIRRGDAIMFGLGRATHSMTIATFAEAIEACDAGYIDREMFDFIQTVYQ